MIIPTGVSIASIGSNIHGKYVTFNDRWTIAWHTLRLDRDNIGNMIGRWVYPLSFHPDYHIRVIGMRAANANYSNGTLNNMVGPWIAEMDEYEATMEVGRIIGNPNLVRDDYQYLHVIAIGRAQYGGSQIMLAVQETTPNGSYSLFENGLLICQDRVRATRLDGVDLQATWTYPMPFAQPPVVVATRAPQKSTSIPDDAVTGVRQGSESETETTLLVGRINGRPDWGSEDYWELSALAIGEAS